MTSGDWQTSVETFSGSLRASSGRLALLMLAAVVLVAALATDYWPLAFYALLVIAAWVALILRTTLRSALCTSEAGMVFTDSRYLIAIPWGDLCCLTDSRSRFSRRLVAHYRRQPVRSASEERPLSHRQRMAQIQVRRDRATSLSFYRIEPKSGTRFGEVLRRHRPDLVAVDALPVIGLGTLCGHALGPGAFERLLPRKALIMQRAVLFGALVFGLIVGTVIGNDYVQIACAIPLAFFVLAVFVQRGWLRLTVSPTGGLTESSYSVAQINVPWSDITSITRSRTGVFHSWLAHYPSRDPAPIIGSGIESSIKELGRTLIERGSQTSINLTDYGLDPRHPPLRDVLGDVRPDLIA